jgi:hypothetical protein
MAGSLFQVFLYLPYVSIFLLETTIITVLYFRVVMQQYPFDIPTEAFPFEIFKQAFVAVQSCVVHLQVNVEY